MMTDLHMCKEYAVSKFFQVKESKVIHVDLQPFLTKSQLENNFTDSWFKLCHLQEILSLVKSPVEDYIDTVGAETAESKKKPTNKEFVITGTTIRAACSFRQRPEEDIFLLYKPSTQKTNDVSNSKPSVQSLNVYPEKLVCFVCPRTNSTSMQLSQLVKSVPSSQHEDISKYFQPAPS